MGARESLNGRKNMARRKVKNGEKSPWGQCLTRQVPHSRRRCEFCFFLAPIRGWNMVGSIFHIRDFQRNVLPKFIKLCPSEEHQHGGRKPNRNICHRLINFKTILTYNTITVRIAKSSKIIHHFNLHDS